MLVKLNHSVCNRKFCGRHGMDFSAGFYMESGGFSRSSVRNDSGGGGKPRKLEGPEIVNFEPSFFLPIII